MSSLNQPAARDDTGGLGESLDLLRRERKILQNARREQMRQRERTRLAVVVISKLAETNC
jgi:hypothetical protein